MAVSQFADKNPPPTARAVDDVLGTARSAWALFCEELATLGPTFATEWKHYGKSAGWFFVLKNGKRTLGYLAPQEGRFLAVIVLGEKAAAAALDFKLPAAIKQAIRDAKPYVEGRSVRLEITDKKTVRFAIELVRFKLAN